MARKKLITRTINKTNVSVLCADLTTNKVVPSEFTIAGTLEGDALLKKLRDLYETDTYKVVAIQSTNVVSELYGMDEQTFLNNAKLLPPRKVYGNNDEEEYYDDDEDETSDAE